MGGYGGFRQGLHFFLWWILPFPKGGVTAFDTVRWLSGYRVIRQWVSGDQAVEENQISKIKEQKCGSG